MALLHQLIEALGQQLLAQHLGITVPAQLPSKPSYRVAIEGKHQFQVMNRLGRGSIGNGGHHPPFQIRVGGEQRKPLEGSEEIRMSRWPPCADVTGRPAIEQGAVELGMVGQVAGWQQHWIHLALFRLQ